MKQSLDEIDRKILNLIQEEFPLTQRPFTAIGKQIGITEKEAIQRIKRLKETGYIRRIGPVLERQKLGYASTLCGIHVDENKIMAAVKEINQQKGITHNYEREGELNLWFTITKKKKEDIGQFVQELEKKFSLKVYQFPAKRVFKIKTYFPL